MEVILVFADGATHAHGLSHMRHAHPAPGLGICFTRIGALSYKRHHTNRYFGTGDRYSKGPVRAVQWAYNFWTRTDTTIL